MQFSEAKKMFWITIQQYHTSEKRDLVLLLEYLNFGATTNTTHTKHRIKTYNTLIALDIHVQEHVRQQTKTIIITQ